MTLLNSTQPRRRIAISLQEFIYQKRSHGIPTDNVVDMYNEWIQQTSLTVDDIDLADWCMRYISTLNHSSLELQDEGVRFNKKIRMPKDFDVNSLHYQQ